jgi:hypothetical protein
MGELPEYVEGIPNICGSEAIVDAAVQAARKRPVFLRRASVPFDGMQSAFAIALHMPAVDSSGQP